MTEIYVDTADLESIKEAQSNPAISGATTNPTIMHRAGITDYLGFARKALEVFKKPISFEVFSDDQDEMYSQAMKLSKLAPNVYVKVPITTTDGHSCAGLIGSLHNDDVKVNVTAVMTLGQVESIASVLTRKRHPSIVSVFAGRIADTGRDPKGVMVFSRAALPLRCKLLWASPREVLNIYQAAECGTDIITVTPELLKKYETMRGKDLIELSVETSKMFYNDGKAAKFTL